MGFSDEVIRFRQHSINERAHYADDAWDLEIKTIQFGWVEICGVHDRTDYDLKRHAEFSKQNFEEILAERKSASCRSIPPLPKLGTIKRIFFFFIS